METAIPIVHRIGRYFSVISDFYFVNAHSMNAEHAVRFDALLYREF
jgi:hypothetical protein